MAYDVTVEKEINKSRAKVFNALMDFVSKALLPDMVAKCDCTGVELEKREIELADGGRVVERLMLQSTTKFLHIQLLKTMLYLSQTILQ